ncbi:MAG: sodium:proton antiporter [Thermostichales cyanobacterium HHBFW_bins_127]
MEANSDLMMVLTLALVAGTGAQLVSVWLGIPSIILLLGMGVVLGPDGLNWLHPQVLGEGLQVLVSLAVALILFEGGLNIRLEELRQVSGSLRNLITVGALISWVGGSVAAHYLGEFPWRLAWLYGSLVVVTGPTVVGSILRQARVGQEVSTLLEAEGILIDPLGAILAVTVLQAVLSPQLSPWELALVVGERLGVGLGVGVVGGVTLDWLLRRSSVSDKLLNGVAVAGVLGTYAASQALLSESGLLAVVLAGMIVRWRSTPEEAELLSFQSQLGNLAIGLLFVLLTANLSLRAVAALGWGAVGTVAVLMLAVRPLAVFVATWGSGLSWQQKLFMGLVAPRGIVAASVASLFGLVLTANGITGGDALKALVFLTIALTVVVQGLLARGLGHWLGLDRERLTMIIGQHILSWHLLQELQAQGEKAYGIAHLTRAENPAPGIPEGLMLVGDALQEQGQIPVLLSQAQTILVMTLNGGVNRLLAGQLARRYPQARIRAVVSDASALPPGVEPLPISLDTLSRWIQGLLHEELVWGRLRDPGAGEVILGYQEGVLTCFPTNPGDPAWGLLGVVAAEFVRDSVS